MVAYTADAGLASWGIYDIRKTSMTQKFVRKPTETRMFKDLGEAAYEFEKKKLVWNGHHWGIGPETFKSDQGLAKFWDVNSVGFMPNGTDFVASMEAKNYPIFGTQYHPEMPSELWVGDMDINHSFESIQLQEHFARLFVMMARANPNTYGNFTETQQHEISQYPRLQTTYQADVYVFK